MNSERLLAISNSLADELQAADVLGLMHNLSSQLRDAINSPSEGTQRAVLSTRETLAEKLREATSNSMSPGMRVDLGALRINQRTPVSELIGVGLMKRIDSAFDSGGYVSVGSLDEIDRLAADIQDLYNALEQLNSGAQALALRTEKLDPGESVVGFTIPRTAVDEELDRLQKEVVFFGRIVSMLAEVVDGSAGGPVKVRNLQSSDFSIHFATTVSVAAGLATVVTHLVQGLKKLTQIRAVKDDMQKLGFEQDLVDEVEQKGEAAIDTAISDVEAEVFREHKVDDNGRLNELRTGIRLSLKGVAARLERGYSVEVRTELPAEPTQDEKQKGASISALSQIRFEQTTPLLKLTDGAGEPVSSRRVSKKKASRKHGSRSVRSE